MFTQTNGGESCISANGEPSRTRTCDPLVKRAVKRVTASHGSYDLLTFCTGCSRSGVHLVTAIHTCLRPLHVTNLPQHSQILTSETRQRRPKTTVLMSTGFSVSSHRSYHGFSFSLNRKSIRPRRSLRFVDGVGTLVTASLL